MVVDIPSITEQQQIGRLFEHLDNLITLHWQKYNKLLALKKSMLEKLFPRADSDVPEIRFAGFTAPWELRKFDEIADRSSTISAASELPRVEYEDIISGTGRLNKNVCGYPFSSASESPGLWDIMLDRMKP